MISLREPPWRRRRIVDLEQPPPPLAERLGAVALLWLVFAVLLPMGGGAINVVSGILSIVPVVAAAALFGIRGGVIMTLATMGGLLLGRLIAVMFHIPGPSGLPSQWPLLFPTWLFVGGAVGRMRDLGATVREQARQLQHDATHDTMTGLANRRLFFDVAERALATSVADSSPLSVLAVDVNLFKEINDTLGHDAGDTALIAVGSRLTAAVRETDLVARFGGDEFAVLLLGADAAAAAAIAATVRPAAAVALPASSSVDVYLSVGAATRESDDDTIAELLRRADVSMYEDKQRSHARRRGVGGTGAADSLAG